MALTRPVLLAQGVAVLWVLAMPAAAQAAQQALLDFSADERARIASFGPWPPPAAQDGSNALQSLPAARRLGRKLFFDPRLAADGRGSCAACHQPAFAMADGLALAQGPKRGSRNTPTVTDAAHQRWFGWGGSHDSLWAASLAALQNPAEMASSPVHVRQVLAEDDRLANEVRRLMRLPALRAGASAAAAAKDPDTALMVALAKALAAWQSSLRSPRTPFDEFRDAMQRGNAVQAGRYPIAAQRGLRLFIGQGQCILCHSGPRFTNGEFADIGIPFFLPGGAGVDGGRHAGLQTLLNPGNAFTRLGPWADDAGGSGAATRHVLLEHRHFGEFRVPGLRGVAATAPYMHNGSLGSLREVIRHYSELNEERLHADGERILRPLRLSEGQVDDLLAFLHSLSPAPRRPAAK